MYRIIKQLEALTSDCVRGLDMATYVELEDFVYKRGQMIEMLLNDSQRFNQRMDYQEQIKALLIQDEVIVSRMNELKEEANEQLTKVEVGRLQKKGYDYLHATDSFFFDKKK